MRLSFRLPAILAALLGGLAMLPTPLRAASSDAELKAAFVYNFTRFVDWPADVLATTPGSLNVCLLGPRDAFFDAIQDLGGKATKDRSLGVRAVTRGESMKHCQVLVVAESEADQFESVLKRLEGLPVLTVNGSARFLDAGGMIGLAMDGGKLRFDVNLAAARRANLVLSSNLLRLAREVRQP